MCGVTLHVAPALMQANPCAGAEALQMCTVGAARHRRKRPPMRRISNCTRGARGL